jgi:hypothetical protein
VDEGRLASGKAIVIPGLAPTFCAGAILFASSRLVHPIQLADFAAFVMNRWQLLRVKDRLKDLDKTVLEIISPIAECFINIDSVQVHNLPSTPTTRPTPVPRLIWPTARLGNNFQSAPEPSAR